MIIIVKCAIESCPVFGTSFIGYMAYTYCLSMGRVRYRSYRQSKIFAPNHARLSFFFSSFLTHLPCQSRVSLYKSCAVHSIDSRTVNESTSKIARKHLPSEHLSKRENKVENKKKSIICI